MSIQTVSFAAAAAPLTTDLLANGIFRIDSKPRVLKRVALTGSAVIGDTLVRLMKGAVEIGTMHNSALLTPQANRDFIDYNEVIPGGVQIYAIVVDAPATSIIYLMLELVPFRG